MSSGFFFPSGGIPPLSLSFLMLAGIVFFLIFLFLFISIRNQSKNSGERLIELEACLAELSKTNSELMGHLMLKTEMSLTQQRDLTHSVNERLDKVTQRLGENLISSGQRTSESLNKLYERLAVIDSAQANISALSSQFVSLQEILSNKQQRGAFGQGRMEAIVRDSLPAHCFSFQETLSNNNRPDCLISLPNTTEKIVIDAKFPLEAFQALRKTKDEADLKQTEKRFRHDVIRHIKDIYERYFIPGETQDTAIMFVPSESIYAELYEHFDDVIQKAYRMRVIIVSPSMLMLAIQVMQSVMKDARMREQAHLIQKEVISLMDDVRRLQERVLDLQRHFGQTSQDVDKILTSSGKIAKRIEKIEKMNLEPPESAPAIHSDLDTQTIHPPEKRFAGL